MKSVLLLFLEGLYKVIADKCLRISKLEQELNCKGRIHPIDNENSPSLAPFFLLYMSFCDVR